jgi:hypothetical protein
VQEFDQELFRHALIDLGYGGQFLSCLIYHISDTTARIALAGHERLPDEIIVVQDEAKAKGAGVGYEYMMGFTSRSVFVSDFGRPLDIDN